MKTLVVLSDSHGNVSSISKLEGLFSECDYIVHLGDGYRDMKNYYENYGNKIYQVDGNCDVYGIGLKYLTLEVEKVNVLITHGDVFGVKGGVESLCKFAKEKGCKVALYGHTHQASVSEVDGVLLVNPGSLSYFTAEKSIAYIVINEEKVVAKINKAVVSG